MVYFSLQYNSLLVHSKQDSTAKTKQNKKKKNIQKFLLALLPTAYWSSAFVFFMSETVT